MENRVGINEIKQFVVALAGLANLSTAAFVDGRIGISDLALLPKLFTALNILGDVEYAALWIEAEDLSQEEKEELCAVFKTAFDLPVDTLEEVVEAGFTILLEAATSIKNIKNLFAYVKK